MKKTILIVSYIMIVTVIGFYLYGSSSNKRILKYRDNESLTNLIEQNYEEYLHDTMLIIGANEYNKKPIYNFVSKDNDYNFTLSIHSFYRKVNDINEYGFMFYLKDLEILNLEDLLEDYERYEEYNNDYLDIKIDIYSKEGIAVTEKFGLSIKSIETKGSAFLPFFISSYEDTKYFKHYNGNNTKVFSEIESIAISLVDSTELGFNPKVHDPFAKILGNKDEYKENEESLFSLTEDGVLVSNELSSIANEYYFIEDSFISGDLTLITSVDYSKLNKYNYLIRNTMVFYSIGVVGMAFILFLLRPLTEYIKRKKTLKI